MRGGMFSTRKKNPQPDDRESVLEAVKNSGSDALHYASRALDKDPKIIEEVRKHTDMLKNQSNKTLSSRRKN